MKACLTLADPSPSRVQEKIGLYKDRVALIEVRLDHLESSQLPRPPADGAALIATCRPEREGGSYRGPERSRLRTLREAAKIGYHWIDLEWDSEISGLPSTTAVIRSSHRFDRLPADLGAWLDRVRGKERVVKLAASVTTTGEAVRLLRWMEKLPEDLTRVVLAMGEAGQPTRYLGSLLGNQWTYVSESGQPLVSGQFSLAAWEEVFGHRELPRNPRVYGVIGDPVAHSLSPLLMAALFRQYRIGGLYFPFHVEALDDWFGYLNDSRLDFRGFSVTLPHKSAVLEFVSAFESPVPAINTLAGRPGRWHGSNTDWDGFLNPLRRRLDLSGKSALVLGNGGVAHTAVRSLLWEGAEVTVAGRNRERVAEFASRYGCEWKIWNELPVESDILVNTTPVGQFPRTDSSPLKADQIRSGLVYDLVYNPPETILLKTARGQGRDTISGLEMFVEQAALQFRQWTSIDPDREKMSGILAARLVP